MEQENHVPVRFAQNASFTSKGSGRGECPSGTTRALEGDGWPERPMLEFADTSDENRSGAQPQGAGYS